ncbi:hypothetical protein F511_07257 [Dorcoceras hygrometricum]|uniref:Acyl-CoA dehydrogenase-related protein n=1 Tax=Dorcoceras hygrometricum TaxID=472368 RepID=A0A2Z7AV64_9LAMI|nr:hypothetical protein F511_07257 [Dorcoceras hygrometricum]
MSLFDLQDVCIAIGSIATLDLPMVVDLIGIYGLKGPYCTLTMTDWFLQALSVIPRGSWGDVARCFTMIRWTGPELLEDFNHNLQHNSIHNPNPKHQNRRLPLTNTPCAAAASSRRNSSGRFDEENPFVQNSSVLLVQPDEGVSVLVMDRIGDYPPQSTEKSRVLVIPVGARHKCQQGRFTAMKLILSLKTLLSVQLGYELMIAETSSEEKTAYERKTALAKENISQALEGHSTSRNPISLAKNHAVWSRKIGQICLQTKVVPTAECKKLKESRLEVCKS